MRFFELIMWCLSARQFPIPMILAITWSYSSKTTIFKLKTPQQKTQNYNSVNAGSKLEIVFLHWRLITVLIDCWGTYLDNQDYSRHVHNSPSKVDASSLLGSPDMQGRKKIESSSLKISHLQTCNDKWLWKCLQPVLIWHFIFVTCTLCVKVFYCSCCYRQDIAANKTWQWSKPSFRNIFIDWQVLFCL